MAANISKMCDVTELVRRKLNWQTLKLIGPLKLIKIDRGIMNMLWIIPFQHVDATSWLIKVLGWSDPNRSYQMMVYKNGVKTNKLQIESAILNAIYQSSL